MIIQEILALYSESYLGAVAISADETIVGINERGMALLKTDRSICGRPLREAAPFLGTLLDEAASDALSFGNPAFGCYVRPCAAIGEPFLTGDQKILTFRDAASDVQSLLLRNVFDHVRESITIWDREGRLLFINDAAIRLEVHTSRTDIGRYVGDLYEVQNNSVLVIPKMLKTKQPYLNLRQDFVTHLGRNLQIVSNNYPVMAGGRMLAAYSMMDDYTEMDAMQRQIVQLQHDLLTRSRKGGGKRSNALAARYHFDDIKFGSPKMKKAVDRCKMIAQSDYPVMIYGETGTGKELFAQSIHNASDRSDGPFIAINCAAIPTTLLESILFGTEKGAYTGADKREGLFEQADGGTLLLDELNSMDVTLQSKLLRVIQEKTFYHVGGSVPIRVDVRIISNINQPPEEAVKAGVLREDLYYRLGVIIIKIPPLRERKEDIYLLCRQFIRTVNKKLKKNIDEVSDAAEALFDAYHWPGNVRELQHAIEFAANIMLREETVITPEYLPDRILEQVRGVAPADESKTPSLEAVLRETGHRYLRRALDKNSGNVSQTARDLGITRQNLQHRMKKYGVEKGEEK